MILDLLKSAAAGMLLHACAALAFGPHAADATAAPHAESVAAAPQACLLPLAVTAPAQDGTLSTHPVTGTRP